MGNVSMEEILEQVICTAEEWWSNDGSVDPVDYKTAIQMAAAKLVYITRGGGRHHGYF